MYLSVVNPSVNREGAGGTMPVPTSISTMYRCGTLGKFLRVGEFSLRVEMRTRQAL